MATAKAKATAVKPFVEKKRDTQKTKCFAITMLVKEHNTTGNKPQVFDYMQDCWADLEYDGMLGDWAVKAIPITEEQFKTAYETF